MMVESSSTDLLWLFPVVFGQFQDILENIAHCDGYNTWQVQTSPRSYQLRKNPTERYWPIFVDAGHQIPLNRATSF